MPASDEVFFRRFRFADDDLPEVEAELAADRAVLAAAGPDAASAAVLAALTGLGESLTALGHEAEAAAHLETALVMARQLGDHDQEVSALLHLATARQYLDDRDTAQQLFQAGLDAADRYGLSRQRHFLLHHRGRCYAEQGQLPAARDCFQQALALRQQLGDPRFIASTQNALADLDRLQA
jgi:HTH-type transcriptional regulator, pleiotropic regulator of extracellular virulence genes